MATGHLEGNLDNLARILRRFKIPQDKHDRIGLRLGDPSAFLPLLNFLLLEYSPLISLDLKKHGFELRGKTDARFTETAFRVFREYFGIKPVLSPPQFLEQGFAVERKVLLLLDVARACKKKHEDLLLQDRLMNGKRNVFNENVAANRMDIRNTISLPAPSSGQVARCHTKAPRPAAAKQPSAERPLPAPITHHRLLPAPLPVRTSCGTVPPDSTIHAHDLRPNKGPPANTTLRLGQTDVGCGGHSMAASSESPKTDGGVNAQQSLASAVGPANEGQLHAPHGLAQEAGIEPRRRPLPQPYQSPRDRDAGAPAGARPRPAHQLPPSSGLLSAPSACPPSALPRSEPPSHLHPLAGAPVPSTACPAPRGPSGSSSSFIAEPYRPLPESSVPPSGEAPQQAPPGVWCGAAGRIGSIVGHEQSVGGTGMGHLGETQPRLDSTGVYSRIVPPGSNTASCDIREGLRHVADAAQRSQVQIPGAPDFLPPQAIIPDRPGHIANESRSCDADQPSPRSINARQVSLADATGRLLLSNTSLSLARPPPQEPNQAMAYQVMLHGTGPSPTVLETGSGREAAAEHNPENKAANAAELGSRDLCRGSGHAAAADVRPNGTDGTEAVQPLDFCSSAGYRGPPDTLPQDLTASQTHPKAAAGLQPADLRHGRLQGEPPDAYSDTVRLEGSRTPDTAAGPLPPSHESHTSGDPGRAAIGPQPMAPNDVGQQSGGCVGDETPSGVDSEGSKNRRDVKGKKLPAEQLWGAPGQVASLGWRGATTETAFGLGSLQQLIQEIAQRQEEARHFLAACLAGEP
eukprot:jgi/Botrbrau1/7859/Bobra.9_2s0035.1